MQQGTTAKPKNISAIKAAVIMTSPYSRTGNSPYGELQNEVADSSNQKQS